MMKYVVMCVLLLVGMQNNSMSAIEHAKKPTVCDVAVPEKPIVVIICAYNTKEWAKNNLDSVMTQDYSNYRIIITNDGSDDGLKEFLDDYKATNDTQNKITVIHNPARRRKLANLYRALYLCHDNEIVLMLDGDDWLAHNQVFKRINKRYDKPIMRSDAQEEPVPVWFTYGQYRNEPAYQAHLWGFTVKGYADAVPQAIREAQSYRKSKFYYMHVRSFYAWLFKQIKLEDFIALTIPGFEGDFYPASNDLAVFFPIVEMAHTHICFLPEILYVRNLYSDIVGFKVDRTVQQLSAREIRRKPRYKPVSCPIYRDFEQYRHAKATVLVCADKDSARISTLLDQLATYVHGIAKVMVLYPHTKQADIPMYHQYPFDVVWLPHTTYNSTTRSDACKKVIVHALENVDTKHLLVLTDAIDITASLDVGDTLYWLERSMAYGFYLARDAAHYRNKINWLIPVEDEVYTWKFGVSKGIWTLVNTLDAVVYPTAQLRTMIEKVRFTNVASLQHALAQEPIDQHHVGLFYQHAKMHVM